MKKEGAFVTPEEDVEAICQFAEFVRDVRDCYPTWTEKELGTEIASLLNLPVDEISSLVSSSLDLLRHAEQ